MLNKPIRRTAGAISHFFFVTLLTAHGMVAAQDLPGGLPILPQDAEIFSVPGETTVNGNPSRLWGFRSWRKSSDIADIYLQRWGAPLVRESVAGSIVLGKMIGNDFITVKLSPTTSGGTQGILSVVNLRSAGFQRDRLLEEAETWRKRMGPDARLIDFSQSTEANARSLLFVFSTGGTLEEAARRATQHLQSLGYFLERDIRDPIKGHDGNQRHGSSVVRLFKRADGAEAQITVHRQEDGRTYSTITMITKK